MILTERDKNVLDFIGKFKIATTGTIQEIFYPSLFVAQRRLKKMYDHQLLNRDRSYVSSQYMYYINKPRQVRHSLILSNSYKELNKLVDIKYFEREFTLNNVRSDGFVAYRYNNKNYIACIEVQISNLPLDVKKYERLYYSNKYKELFPVFPLIIAITNKNIPETKLEIIQIKEDLSNLKEALHILE